VKDKISAKNLRIITPNYENISTILDEYILESA
jgi:hypothetical protein